MLTEYLANEIFIAVNQKNNNNDLDYADALNEVAKQEKNHLYNELRDIIKNNESLEIFWDSY